MKEKLFWKRLLKKPFVKEVTDDFGERVKLAIFSSELDFNITVSVYHNVRRKKGKPMRVGDLLFYLKLGGVDFEVVKRERVKK